MRRMIKTFVLICTALVTLNANASDILSVKIENESTIHVSLEHALKGQKLYLKNYEGEVLFTMTLAADQSFQKTFDLTLVKDGIYFVETETAFDIKVTPVVKNAQGVALIDTSVKLLFKPTIKVKKGMIHILFNNIEGNKVTLSINDEEGIELHEEQISNQEYVIKRAFNFAEVPSGKYTIHFTTGDRTFKEEVSI
ncbi:hypothetical protein [Aquimarina brevivitae]|uniref:Secreted protein (Por secretion system target) n=1 Tax=Aquimarina brevivitae TaxID=323412 RepID=A0A4Q7P3I4_9FLAO|nr:hypothetical protein [Aquimarina brevivitae]RZS93970.1 hypothetical protein EV197_2552 [Aquimarina brevivitae]